MSRLNSQLNIHHENKQNWNESMQRFTIDTFIQNFEDCIHILGVFQIAEKTENIYIEFQFVDYWSIIIIIDSTQLKSELKTIILTRLFGSIEHLDTTHIETSLEKTQHSVVKCQIPWILGIWSFTTECCVFSSDISMCVLEYSEEQNVYVNIFRVYNLRIQKYMMYMSVFQQILIW